MALRDVSFEQVEKTIKRGSRFKQTDGWLSIYGCVAVAYKVRNNKIVVKTVMIT
ncbi:MAG: hypothetical protein KKE20_01250 [Nanoarchaeota archaeon]|nr:hypothetical protein [Nanoarchaeota archaeon]